MKTTVVGSYPIPDWLKALPNEETMLDAITVALRAQEAAGIDVIGDGEIGRWNLARNAPGGMVERFVEPMEGVQWRLSYAQKSTFRARPEMQYRTTAPGVVTGPLGHGQLDLQAEWDRICALTTKRLKYTVTSPYMLAKVIADDYYQDLEALTMAFADLLANQIQSIDASIVQVDDPNLPGSPQDSLLAARAINRLLDVVHGERAVHLCFGNYGGQLIQRGAYTQLLEFMNALNCDHLVLETTRRSDEELLCLCDVRPGIGFGLGVIDVKDLQIERAELIARRIEKLAKIVGEKRIFYVNPDCGLRMLPRSVADGKMRALVAGRDLFLDR
ncbi:cobalamin-independent methionine synthase II family protein [Chloroflexi bacterium TSY]|nr:cobalamin-independent methionine synthase II family protein [Chloroflexi bacterium TSY]